MSDQTLSQINEAHPRPRASTAGAGVYHRIEKAIRYLDINAREQPSLEDVARHLGLSTISLPSHVQ